ncbi:unnamed protein product, partial [Symbiodinium pilosum]
APSFGASFRAGRAGFRNVSALGALPAAPEAGHRRLAASSFLARLLWQTWRARVRQIRRVAVQADARGDGVEDVEAAEAAESGAKKNMERGKAKATQAFLGAPVLQAWEVRHRPSAIAQAAARARAIHPPQVSEASEGHQEQARKDDVEVVPDTVPGASKANFSRIYAREEWGASARSGLGSREETTREFRAFLERFLQQQCIHSVVDAGCGHWPSGYQRFMKWQGVHYTGVDVVPYVVQENTEYFQDGARLASHELSSARSICGDVSERLPPADLLLVKDGA